MNIGVKRQRLGTGQTPVVGSVCVVGSVILAV